MAKKKTTTRPKAKKKPAVKKTAVKKTAVKKTAIKKTTPKIRATSFLNPGVPAPKFHAVDENGSPVRLESLRGRTIVLYFYPKDDTPGCTKEACDFRDSFARLQAEGIVVLGVSRDSPESHARFRSKFDLPFSLVSDADGKVCEAFGVWKEKSMYGRKYMGIERSTFVIDPELRIAKVYPKVSVTGHVDEVLSDIRAMRES